MASMATPADSTRPQSSMQTTAPSIETPDPNVQAARNPVSPNQPHAFRVPESPRNGPTDPSRKQAKVAIPRLKRTLENNVDGATSSGGRHRVTHACEPCRHRKTKCSGERPICRHCQDFKISCYYADGKRDRVKKQFGSMTEKVADYEKLLKDLSTRVNEADAALIKSALDKETSFEADDVASVDGMAVASVEQVPTDDESGAESDVSAGAGSTGALDRTEEDFTRDGARDTGFMGKNSEITWMQRLQVENKFGDEKDMPNMSSTNVDSSKDTADSFNPMAEAEAGFSVHETSYHLDDESVTTFEHVDPYEVPTAETARNLFDAYMTRVHPSFPIVSKINLTIQFQKFLSGQAQRPPEKWLAILNLIFAIAAKYSHLVQADWKGDERDHIIYFTRARLLSVNSETVFQHPDLQVIQITGLISFYFVCIHQINRAWSMSGIAIRWATALGLNMRNDSKGLKETLKEIRYRVWWALYTLEHRLCSMTGRVNCILDDHCTTPLPIPLEEDKFDTGHATRLLSKMEQQGSRAPFYNSHSPSSGDSSSNSRSRSGTKNTGNTGSRSPSTIEQNVNLDFAKDIEPNTSLYFLHLIQLTRLTQSIFHAMYNPANIVGAWSDIQDRIRQLSEQLETWYRNLPPMFDFKRKQRDRDYYEFRLSLGFFYYGTKIMVHRPCLCRLDRKIPHQSTKSLDFNRSAATTCVDAARDLLALIPDEPNAVGLMKVGPWWSALHSLVQASTVLMLEISFRAHHMPEEADDVLECSKKGVRWLHAMGEDNPSARRAWKLCNSMLHGAVARIGRDVNDMPTRPPGRSPSAGAGGSGQSRSGMQNYSTPPVSNSMTSMAGVPQFTRFDTLDQLMQYDQYFPFDTSGMVDGIDGMEGGMEFMNNSYHDNGQMDGHHGGHGQMDGRPEVNPRRYN